MTKLNAWGSATTSIKLKQEKFMYDGKNKKNKNSAYKRNKRNNSTQGPVTGLVWTEVYPKISCRGSENLLVIICIDENPPTNTLRHKLTTTSNVSRRRKRSIKPPGPVPIPELALSSTPTKKGRGKQNIHILSILRRLILIHAPNIIPANLLLLGSPEATEPHQSLHLRLLIIHNSLHLVAIHIRRYRRRGGSISIRTETGLSTTLWWPRRGALGVFSMRFWSGRSRRGGARTGAIAGW